MSVQLSRPAGALEPVDVDTVFAFASGQLRALVTDHPGQVPVYTEGGRWHLGTDAWAPAWTGGFLAGQLWILAERSGDSWWRSQAEKYSEVVAPRRTDTGTHDIGFLFSPSWGRWHRLDPSSRSKDILVEAGRTLASNFNPQGGYIRTWVDPGSTFIDIMMNVDIIFQAAELSGDSELHNVAAEHALTTRRHLVRGDATTMHEGWFDPATGEFLRAATHQGWRADSSWVRGHCWAIYGFGNCYQRTGDDRFLSTAAALADAYVIKTADEPVGPNDWLDPDPEFPFEASGASVAAAGLLQLAEILGHQGAKYREHGTRVLQRLAQPPFLASDDSDWEGLVRLATYHRGSGLGVQESNMWGDYYFLEAVERYERLTRDDHDRVSRLP